MFCEIYLYFNITFFFSNLIFLYAITIMSGYFILAVLSVLAFLDRYKKRKSVNFDYILRSPLAPKIAVIAPAFNESQSIVENTRSLLSLRYNNYDIVIVNDGSTDDSLTKMIDAYDLYPSDTKPFNELGHKEIKNVYRSSHKAFNNLIFIDKFNGGKADSLNAGINYTDAKYVANIDVDCIIEQDALLKMVEPFLQEVDSIMIATGGVIRIANNCEVTNGRITKVRLPNEILPLFQTLEYLRAFLLGRMAWSHINGLLIISGAFGLFDKEILLEAGGYNTATVGEDMELLVRMRRLMEDKRVKYKVHYIPDPLCWTEVPNSLKTLSRQRNRWTRGSIETLLIHKKMFLNPKYGILGLLSYPYWLIFEFFAPLIEFLGLIYFLVLAIFGLIDWEHFALLLALVYIFAVILSLFTILMEELTYRKYESYKSLITLIGLAFVEPIFYHPIGVVAAVRGNWDKLILKKSTWGHQVRQGFAKVDAN